MSVVANISLAAFPGLRHLSAASAALDAPISEALLGTLSGAQLQLVPQSFGVLDETVIDTLKAAYPATSFRLHANVRVDRSGAVYDLSNFKDSQTQWVRAGDLSQKLGATGYSAHAGLRNSATLADVLDAARRASDIFGCPVAVEGLYPERGSATRQNVSTWDEYRALFGSDVPYALDLSHLNIVAKQSGERNETLVCEMLSCERCHEIHLSDNDGTGDWHQVLTTAPWWWDLVPYFNPSSVVFTEGNQRRTHRLEKNK